MKTSLIISTYNWPAALELCFKSLLLQTQMPDEIIIADDGSGVETRTLIQKYKTLFPVTVKHVWHADNGFQLALIRNKAILSTLHDYIIQVDGDLILHPDFIADHIRLARPGKFVSGSRLLLPEVFSKKILEDCVIPSFYQLFKKGKNPLNAVRIPILTRLLATIYKTNQPYYVKGCNMAFWRNDLLAVNGYNEAITGWGKEDSELAVRLINNGVERLFIKFGGICYHIFHHIASREQEDLNDKILNETIRNRIVSTPYGINSYAETDVC
ncbi:glycosyltransferase [Flavihumibacter sp. R14]|nr:glycosyltransferase [Flavihumibacter soli]